jgi:hypothetical protein
MNVHPPKWLVYVGILLFCGVVALFIHVSVTGIIDNARSRNRHDILDVREQARHHADSLTVVIGTEKLMQQLQADSLQRRVESVARKAATDKHLILKRYEDAFKQVLALSADSIAVLDSCNGPKYDSLLQRYGLGRK